MGVQVSVKVNCAMKMLAAAVVGGTQFYLLQQGDRMLKEFTIELE